MGFVKAKIKVIGEKDSFEDIALIDTGAWYTVIDENIAKKIGVNYTGLTVLLTTFSGHKIKCKEAIAKEVILEGEKAPYEIIVVAEIPKQVKEILEKHEASKFIIIGTHTLERLRFVVDVVSHRLVKVSSILMI